VDAYADVGEAAVVAEPDPSDRVTLDDSINLAMHLLLERLTPAERTSFVLHDVFQHSFDEVATIVGRTPAACRQLASRARRSLESESARGRFPVETAEQRRVTQQFIDACATGDLAALVAVLDPDVDGWGDVGGRRQAGAERVARGALGYLRRTVDPTFISIPTGDRAGVVVLDEGDVAAILVLTIEAERVTHIEAYASPGARRAVRAALGPDIA
jgi:RNA polymerase sigma-70 factor (ECF subfamily)